MIDRNSLSAIGISRKSCILHFLKGMTCESETSSSTAMLYLRLRRSYIKSAEIGSFANVKTRRNW